MGKRRRLYTVIEGWPGFEVYGPCGTVSLHTTAAAAEKYAALANRVHGDAVRLERARVRRLAADKGKGRKHNG